MTNRRSRRQSGVSLIEALVAMAVMAFGMLGMVGVQATLRLNGDVAKQRSEALRLAQRAIEDRRSFVQIPSGAERDYTEIADDTTNLTAAQTGATNTAYTINQDVTDLTDLNDPRMKILQVRVSWLDRTNAPQGVELNTVIAGIPPDLAGTLLLAANVDASGVSTRSPLGRNRAIPVTAVDIGGGSSGYMPPDGGNAALVFDNTTGVVKLCETTATSTATLTAVNVTNCSTDPAQFLSGYVRFDYGIPQTAASADNPTGDAMALNVVVELTTTPIDARGSVCFDDAPNPPVVGRRIVNYNCVVFSDAAGTWSGKSLIEPVGWTIGAMTGRFKVCRYTTLTSDSGLKAQHPRDYVGVVAGDLLINQNFLVIPGLASCPADTAADPAAGNFVNSNTRQHQP